MKITHQYLLVFISRFVVISPLLANGDEYTFLVLCSQHYIWNDCFCWSGKLFFSSCRYLIASHTTDYQHPMLFFNTVAVFVLVIAKFPHMHKVRIFGINADQWLKIKNAIQVLLLAVMFWILHSVSSILAMNLYSLNTGNANSQKCSSVIWERYGTDSFCIIYNFCRW